MGGGCAQRDEGGGTECQVKSVMGKIYRSESSDSWHEEGEKEGEEGTVGDKGEV